MSSMMTTVMGWISLEKSVISRGVPLSRTVKSSLTRSGTSRPSASLTVA